MSAQRYCFASLSSSSLILTLGKNERRGKEGRALAHKGKRRKRRERT